MGGAIGTITCGPFMSKTILFLYGTLKRGQKSHHFLEGQEFLGEATTMPLYRLYACGWHPALLLDTEHGLEVKGELWAVDDACLAKLDVYEGAPNWFYRGDVAVRDCFETAQTYFYNGTFPPGTASGGKWPFAT
jgi:gamma-glutamylaminecyclotransferase